METSPRWRPSAGRAGCEGLVWAASCLEKKRTEGRARPGRARKGARLRWLSPRSPCPGAQPPGTLAWVGLRLSGARALTDER